MSEIDLKKHAEQVKKYKRENNKFFNRLKTKTPKNINYFINSLHDKAFEKIDCLDCANCCKTTPPIITDRDISRISKHLKLKQGEFMQKYVLLDNDGDYIFKTTPCVFLDQDNYCKIYEVRPKACREYPHTDSNKISLNLMKKNIEVCPAVYEMVKEMKKSKYNRS